MHCNFLLLCTFVDIASGPQCLFLAFEIFKLCSQVMLMRVSCILGVLLKGSIYSFLMIICTFWIVVVNYFFALLMISSQIEALILSFCLFDVMGSYFLLHNLSSCVA